MASNRGIGNEDYFITYYGDRDWKFYRSVLAQIIQFSQPGAILDIGAGTGLFLECAHRWGLDCTGIEGSWEAIRIAGNRYPQVMIQKHVLDGPLPFEGTSFQTVVMNQVVEHLDSRVAEECFREVFRVLRPGGMFLVTSPSKYNLPENRNDPTHVTMYSPHELKNLLVATGFVDIIPVNIALSILGTGFVARGLVSLLFRLTRWDRLSATANCIAYKPERVRE